MLCRYLYSHSRFYTLSYLTLIAACTTWDLQANKRSMALNVSVQLDGSSATYDVKHEIDGIYKAILASIPPASHILSVY